MGDELNKPENLFSYQKIIQSSSTILSQNLFANFSVTLLYRNF